MKILLRMLLLLLIVSIFSCKDNKTGFSPVRTIDLSDLGNINAIHVFNNNLYILDASYSILYKMSNIKPVKILKVPIQHRAFLLDFAIRENQALFVNTYDEIFITNLAGKMLDTIKVSRPDKISLTESKAYITERFPTGNNLKLIAISDSTEEILSPEITNYSPVKAGDCNLFYQDKLWIGSSIKQTLFSLDGDNLFTAYTIESGLASSDFRPGRFYVKNGKILCLGTINGKNYLANCQINDKLIRPISVTELPEEIDLSISEITDDKVYLYDYLNKQILIYNWPE